MKHLDEGFWPLPSCSPIITMRMRPVHSRHLIEYETKPSILVINLIGLQSHGQTTKMSLDSSRRDCGIKGSIVGILNSNLLLSFDVSQLHRQKRKRMSSLMMKILQPRRKV